MTGLAHSARSQQLCHQPPFWAGEAAAGRSWTRPFWLDCPLYRSWEVLTDAPPSASRAAPVRQELPRPVLQQVSKVAGERFVLTSALPVRGRTARNGYSGQFQGGVGLRPCRADGTSILASAADRI